MGNDKSKLGIQLSDLMGSLKSVRIIGTKSTKKGDVPILTIDAQLEDESNITFGIITQEAIESFLAHGKKENGSIFVEVPEKLLAKTEGKQISWLNFVY